MHRVSVGRDPPNAATSDQRLATDRAVEFAPAPAASDAIRGSVSGFDGVTSMISAGSAMVGDAFGVLLGLALGSVVGLRSGGSPRAGID